MIPSLIELADSPWLALPPGVHPATLEEVREIFAYNEKRRWLFEGLVLGVEQLRQAGCLRVFLDGSYVTSKPFPGDYDACWDTQGVDVKKLDILFWQPMYLKAPRKAQKEKYRGEYFPDIAQAAPGGIIFMNFFQQDRNGNKKGIIGITL